MPYYLAFFHLSRGGSCNFGDAFAKGCWDTLEIARRPGSSIQLQQHPIRRGLWWGDLGSDLVKL